MGALQLCWGYKCNRKRATTFDSCSFGTLKESLVIKLGYPMTGANRSHPLSVAYLDVRIIQH